MKKRVISALALTALVLSLSACGTTKSVEHATVQEGILTGQSAQDIVTLLTATGAMSENAEIKVFNSEEDATADVKNNSKHNTYRYGNVLLVLNKDADSETLENLQNTLPEVLVTQETIQTKVATDLGVDSENIEFTELKLDTAIVNKYWYVTCEYDGSEISYKLKPSGEIKESTKAASAPDNATAQAAPPSEQDIQSFNDSVLSLQQGDFNGILLGVEYNEDFSDYTITVSNDLQALPDNEKSAAANKIANEIQNRAHGYNLSSDSPMIYMYYQSGTKFAESKWSNPREMELKN